MTTAAADPPSATARVIACMEVWGGHESFSGAVSVPGNDVFVSCTPWAGESRGGDIYYVSNCAAGLITRFVLADVSGHGAQVAGTARRLRDLMRRNINRVDQSALAIALNEEFARVERAGLFATAALLTYFAPTDHLIVCNAGHPRPLLYRAAPARWSPLDSQIPGVVTPARPAPVGVANLPLGVIDPTDYEQFAIRLDPGDLVVLYSDALIEAGRPALGEAGFLQLAATLDPARPDAMPDLLREAVARAAGASALEDDATVIVLNHNGSNPATPTLGERAAILARMLGLL